MCGGGRRMSLRRIHQRGDAASFRDEWEARNIDGKKSLLQDDKYTLEQAYQYIAEEDLDTFIESNKTDDTFINKIVEKANESYNKQDAKLYMSKRLQKLKRMQTSVGHPASNEKQFTVLYNMTADQINKTKNTSDYNILPITAGETLYSQDDEKYGNDYTYVKNQSNEAGIVPNLYIQQKN